MLGRQALVLGEVMDNIFSNDFLLIEKHVHILKI